MGFLFAFSGYRLLGRDEKFHDCAVSSMAAARRELYRRSIAWAFTPCTMRPKPLQLA
jgi:hypothetical protein